MKFNQKLLVAALAGTLVLGSGVSAYATADNTNNAKKLQEKVSVEVLNEILSNVDKIIEKLEKDPELLKLEKDPELKKLGKVSEVEKLKKEVKDKREILKTPTGFNTEYAIGMLRHFDEAIEKIKQLKPQSDFDTKEKAEEAAKKDLDTELVKNAFDVEEKDGKWHYTLKFKEIQPEKSTTSDKKEKTEEKTAEEKKQAENEKKIDGLKNLAEKQKEEAKKVEEEKKKAEEEAKKAEEEKKKAEEEDKKAEEEKKKAEEEAKKAEEEKKKAEEEKKSEEMKAEAKKKAEEFKKNAEKKKETLVRKSEKVNTTTSDNKVSKPVTTTTDKKKLPKAGIETEVLTLATASLAGVLGAFVSLKKRK